MADSSRTLDVEEMISFSDDLLKVLQDPRDQQLNDLSQSQSLQHSLFDTCHSDLNQARSFFQEYQNKIESYKQKIEEARSETAADAELDLLQRELDEQLEKERLLKALSSEFNDLEQQQTSVQERRKNLQKVEQEKRRTQMLCSMYASVTNILPNLNDQSKISGYIVEKDKNSVDKFEYDTSKMTILDVCNDIWKTISD